MNPAHHIRGLLNQGSLKKKDRLLPGCLHPGCRILGRVRCEWAGYKQHLLMKKFSSPKSLRENIPPPLECVAPWIKYLFSPFPTLETWKILSQLFPFLQMGRSSDFKSLTWPMIESSFVYEEQWRLVLDTLFREKKRLTTLDRNILALFPSLQIVWVGSRPGTELAS